MRRCRFCGQLVSVQTYDAEAFIQDALEHLARCSPDPGIRAFEEELLSKGTIPAWYDMWKAWATLGWTVGTSITLKELDELYEEAGRRGA
jgi:hypothetical protein